MRKLFAAAWLLLLAGILCLAQQEHVSAFWQSRDSNYNVAVSGGGGTPTWTNQAAIVSTACGFQTTCTVGTITVSAGLNAVVAGVDNNAASSGTITNITICGTSLTPDATSTIPSSGAGAAIAHGTLSGGSCSVTVTFSQANAIEVAGIGVGLLSNLTSSTPGTACGTQFPGSTATPYPCTGGLTVSSGGFGIVGFFQNNNSTAITGTGALTMDATASTAGASIGIGHATATFATGTNVVGASGFCQCGDEGEPWR